MNPTLTPSSVRSDRLTALRNALSASGWSAQVVQLPAGERAETVVEGFGTDGI